MVGCHYKNDTSRLITVSGLRSSSSSKKLQCLNEPVRALLRVCLTLMKSTQTALPLLLFRVKRGCLQKTAAMNQSPTKLHMKLRS